MSVGLHVITGPNLLPPEPEFRLVLYYSADKPSKENLLISKL
jgi:hypothetical protein